MSLCDNASGSNAVLLFAYIIILCSVCLSVYRSVCFYVHSIVM